METLFSDKVKHGDPNNLVKIADNLKGLTDRALIEMQQSPTSFAPAYMIDAEMQRRKKLRDSGQVMAGHGGSTNVRADLNRAFKEKFGGLASLPGLQKAEGGVIPSFKEGGYFSRMMDLLSGNIAKEEEEEVSEDAKEFYKRTGAAGKNFMDTDVQQDVAAEKGLGSMPTPNLQVKPKGQPKTAPTPTPTPKADAGIGAYEKMMADEFTKQREARDKLQNKKDKKILGFIRPEFLEQFGTEYAMSGNLGKAGKAGIGGIKEADKLRQQRIDKANQRILDLGKELNLSDYRKKDLSVKERQIAATSAANYAKIASDQAIASANRSVKERELIAKNQEMITKFVSDIFENPSNELSMRIIESIEGAGGEANPQTVFNAAVDMLKSGMLPSVVGKSDL